MVVQKKRGEVPLDVIWNCSKCSCSDFMVTEYAPALAAALLVFRELRWSIAVTITAHLQHNQSCSLSAPCPAVFGFLWSIIFGNPEVKVSLLLRSHVLRAPLRSSGNDQVVQVTDITKWLSTHWQTRIKYATTRPRWTSGGDVVVQSAPCVLMPLKINHDTTSTVITKALMLHKRIPVLPIILLSCPLTSKSCYSTRQRHIDSHSF